MHARTCLLGSFRNGGAVCLLSEMRRSHANTKMTTSAMMERRGTVRGGPLGRGREHRERRRGENRTPRRGMLEWATKQRGFSFFSWEEAEQSRRRGRQEGRLVSLWCCSPLYWLVSRLLPQQLSLSRSLVLLSGRGGGSGTALDLSRTLSFVTSCWVSLSIPIDRVVWLGRVTSCATHTRAPSISCSVSTRALTRSLSRSLAPPQPVLSSSSSSRRVPLSLGLYRYERACCFLSTVAVAHSLPPSSVW